jgi:hypothetical protein
MPPMWYTWAQMRRIRSGNQVGTEEKTMKRRLMTGSERIRTATQRFAAVASAIEGSGYSDVHSDDRQEEPTIGNQSAVS